ncbi:MAG: phosphoglucomutase [Bacteroidota bacterium]
MDIIFGTDGWRGLLDREMDHDSVSLVAQAFAQYALQRSSSPSVVIGYDGRRNSRTFAELFASILDGNGIRYYLSDKVVPTPVVSYTVKARSLDLGVMITASHNPPEYNGIKFKASYGGPFSTEETHIVETLIGRSRIRRSIEPVRTEDLLMPYRKHLETIVDFAMISKSSIIPLIDSMSGAGATILQDMLAEHSVKSHTIFEIPDESFSGRFAEPIEKNLKPLSEELQRGTFSLGVATDGDADRLGVLLENGEWLSSQETILLLTDYLKRTKNISGDIIKTSSVTNLLKANFESDECKVHDVQVGFKYICEKMIETNAAFGAEESGGYGFKGHIPERDGILSALLFIEMLASSPYNRLSEYVSEKRKEFGEIFYDRIDHPYHKEDRNDKLPMLAKNAPKMIASFTVKDSAQFYSSRGIVNGLKFSLEGNARWLLLRSSETEPLIRIYAEGESMAEVKDILNAGMELVEHH